MLGLLTSRWEVVAPTQTVGCPGLRGPFFLCRLPCDSGLCLLYCGTVTTVSSHVPSGPCWGSGPWLRKWLVYTSLRFPFTKTALTLRPALPRPWGPASLPPDPWCVTSDPSSRPFPQVMLRRPHPRSGLGAGQGMGRHTEGSAGQCRQLPASSPCVVLLPLSWGALLRPRDPPRAPLAPAGPQGSPRPVPQAWEGCPRRRAGTEEVDKQDQVSVGALGHGQQQGWPFLLGARGPSLAGMPLGRAWPPVRLRKVLQKVQL